MAQQYGTTTTHDSKKGASSRAQPIDLESGKKVAAPIPHPEPEKKTTSPMMVRFILVMFVVCGTFSTVLSKILFQSSSVGSDGQVHAFQKPLFQNTGMFTGMSLCLLVFFIQQQFFTVKAKLSEKQPLLAGAEGEATASPSNKVYYVVLVPALCDFVATYMMNIGLLWINASVWQMVRGSIVFFVATVRYITLGKAIHKYQWFGIFVVMSALAIIGFSCVMSEGNADPTIETVTVWQKIGGVALVFAAQLVQAIQCVVEEHLLHGLGATDMQVVGLEGIWGLILCVAIAMPAAAYTTMSGMHEDSWDTLVMLQNSTGLMFLFALYVMVILGYNTFAMKVTLYLDSVRRNVLDTLRTMFIWATLTIIHYTYSTAYGEEWNTWSYLQLAGFGVLICGLFTYYRVIDWPFFDYPDDKVVAMEPAPPVPVAQVRTLTPSAKRPVGARSPYIPGSPRR